MRPSYLVPIVATWMTGCLTVAGLDKDFTGDLGKSSTKAGAAGTVAQGGTGGAGGGEAGTTSMGGAGQGGGGVGGTQGGGAGQSSGGAAGSVGGAGQGGGGAPMAGAGGAGKAGSHGLGGAATSCPPTTFNGLPLCADTGPYPCAECVCNDIAAASGCGAKYKACFNDTACSQTIECLLRQCSLEECAPLSTGNMAIVMDFVGCMTGVCSAKCM